MARARIGALIESEGRTLEVVRVPDCPDPSHFEMWADGRLVPVIPAHFWGPRVVAFMNQGLIVGIAKCVKEHPNE